MSVLALTGVTSQQSSNLFKTPPRNDLRSIERPTGEPVDPHQFLQRRGYECVLIGLHKDRYVYEFQDPMRSPADRTDLELRSILPGIFRVESFNNSKRIAFGISA